MTLPKDHDATQKLSARVYDHLRQRTLRSIGLTEKQIDALHADVARAIKKDLKGLIRHTDKVVERALRKHYNLAFQNKRKKLVEGQIQQSAKDGADADFETFKRIYGDEAGPFSGRYSSDLRRHLRLLPPPGLEDK